MKSDEAVTVSLPPDLYSRVDDRTRRTDFSTPDAYVKYVLEEVLSRVERDGAELGSAEVDEAEVQSRLRSLGYLDE
ncbi:hypothetical protein ACFQPA_01895 [Halomarina halobia]|uniref:CopG family transcriptional regulator n=1 Tax=Halomarina halobia TaxID=3033386 RepID=A0ABD6A853_9EURY|nr:hypothetical protein [Halomarina sp. PSR21]